MNIYVVTQGTCKKFSNHHFLRWTDIFHGDMMMNGMIDRETTIFIILYTNLIKPMLIT